MYKNIIFDIGNVLFEQSPFAPASFEPIMPGIALLTHCASLQDASGKQKYQLFALSNYDAASIALLGQAYSNTMELFTGVVTPTDSGHKKPNPAIFNYLCKRYGISAIESVFIDDKNSNIITANTLGMTGILCIDFASVRTKLQTLNII